MKKIQLSFIVAFLFCVSVMKAQELNPVKWTFGLEKINETEYYLVWTGNLDKGWWTYSQFIKEGGPIPTSFHIKENKAIELVGNISESGAKTKEGIEPMFDLFLKEYAEQVVFKQKIKLLSAKPLVEGYLEYMCCDNEQCLPPKEIPFSFVF